MRLIRLRHLIRKWTNVPHSNVCKIRQCDVIIELKTSMLKKWYLMSVNSCPSKVSKKKSFGFRKVWNDRQENLYKQKQSSKNRTSEEISTMAYDEYLGQNFAELCLKSSISLVGTILKHSFNSHRTRWLYLHGTVYCQDILL